MTEFYPENDVDSDYDLYDYEAEWTGTVFPFIIVVWIITVIAHIVEALLGEDNGHSN